MIKPKSYFSQMTSSSEADILATVAEQAAWTKSLSPAKTPRWIELFEAGSYREALRESILSGTCTGAQMQGIAALVIAEAMDR